MASEQLPYQADLDLAFTLADEADRISMQRFLASDLRVETKPDLTPVTEADQAVERRLRDLIAVARPDDVVVGEEYGGLEPGTVPTGRTWIIDPIDGTKNYVRGVPVWATLIALLDDGDPVVGMVSAPGLARRWWAQTGGGAWTATRLADHPAGAREIKVSKVANLADASLSYSDRQGWDERTAAGRFELLASACWRTRAYGDFYSHMLVAEGAVDVAAEPELNAWDIAALIPIVVEAGGSVSGYDGSLPLTAGGAISSNGLLHQEVRDLLS